jgi:biopolymer transport protein ExbD
MSAQSTSLLGYGLYFIDVLACLLFCVTLALVGARFGREQSVPIDLPRLERSAQRGAELPGLELSVRAVGDDLEIYLEGERLGLAELGERLRAAEPPRVVVRSEDSALARVIAVAHDAGVRDIELAYRTAGGKETP